MRPSLRAILLLAAGIGLLALLVAYAGLGGTIQALREAPPALLLLAFATYAAFFALRGVRWKILLSSSAPDVRVWTTTTTTAVGWLANSILPLKGGDVLRAALLARRERVGIATSAATVGLERVLDLVGLALMTALGLLILPRAAALPPGIERALAAAWLLPLGALALLALLVRHRARVARASDAVARRTGVVGRKLAALVDDVLAGLAALATRPALLARLVPLTLAISFAQALIFTLLVIAFLRAEPATAFAGSALFLLSFIVSLTPGQVGTYEAAFAAVFVGMGFPFDQAIAAAILTHLSTTLAVGLLGGAGLAAFGASPRALATSPHAKPGGASR